jgi:hypothetical protein
MYKFDEIKIIDWVCTRLTLILELERNKRTPQNDDEKKPAPRQKN